MGARVVLALLPWVLCGVLVAEDRLEPAYRGVPGLFVIGASALAVLCVVVAVLFHL